MKVTILGAGSWGTALAIHLSQFHQVILWGRNLHLVKLMNSMRENPVYLPGYNFPKSLQIESCLENAVYHKNSTVDLLIIATPVSGLRSLLFTLIEKKIPLGKFIWLCKGFENNTSLLPHQIVAEILPNHYTNGVLSGPSFACEIAKQLPAALTIASFNSEYLREIVKIFYSNSLRIYTSQDITGVEVGGAVKNILAIAAGISDGLGLGLNARAALLTHGLEEMKKLGVALGGKANTFIGLTGIGDLILTATSNISRNRQVGLKLAKGIPLCEITSQLGHMAEGISCARTIQTLGITKNLDIPIISTVCNILFKNVNIRNAISILMKGKITE